jgi:hypothetical protein
MAQRESLSLPNQLLHYNTRVVLKAPTDEIHNCLLLKVLVSLHMAVEELYKRFIKDLAKPKDSLGTAVAQNRVNAPLHNT